MKRAVAPSGSLSLNQTSQRAQLPLRDRHSLSPAALPSCTPILFPMLPISARPLVPQESHSTSQFGMGSSLGMGHSTLASWLLEKISEPDLGLSCGVTSLTGDLSPARCSPIPYKSKSSWFFTITPWTHSSYSWAACPEGCCETQYQKPH